MSVVGTCTGYHGTFESNIDNIIKEGFIYNKRKDHWLGQGIYFYLDFKLAKWWIERKILSNDSFNLQNPAVIQCITKDNVKILNLDENSDIDIAREQITEVLEDLKAIGKVIKFKKNQKHEYRCFLLDLVKKKYEYDVIIKTFEKINPSYREFDSKEYNEIFKVLDINYEETQICITSNHSIKEKKCVYPIDKDSYNKIDSKTIIRKRRGFYEQ